MTDKACPGTEAKIRLMEERAARGEPIFQAGDPVWEGEGQMQPNRAENQRPWRLYMIPSRDNSHPRKHRIFAEGA